MSERHWHKGACHCGAVTFEVEAPDDVVIDDCNCSICAKTGFLHLIVSASRFRILSGEDKLTAYTFNTGTAKHLFCSVCGVKPFYVPRSNPDGWSVNFRCLDRAEFGHVEIRPFDGGNWEANGASLAHLSKD
ncbi:GFA family protein [Parvibaculum sedimenti]|uniref:GFA family protein n=1 Tax=Parvibaculum sedimenti TaxID=2608632 RepID=A0A6N6VRZ8_9HYPH|nr:GFA family protein [Parvibaculum sedimenti]KAB7742213.1 GFA family protein [Parvibaculum sedimenti]